MNWLTNFVRPKLKQLVKRDVPKDFWHKCPACDYMIFHRDLEANLSVCQQCGHHLRLSAKNRLQLLFDDSKYQRIELPKAPHDPLKFRDQKRYTDRLKQARNKTEEEDAIIVAHGTMGNLPVVIAVLNFDFMGGSMGAAVGDGLITAARLAIVQQAPLIAVTASGGARMQEGAISLMQMPRTIIAVQEVKEAGLPYIVVLTDPTTGGVSASFAMLGDIHIAEKGAMIGFAGARVIEQTVRETLPDGFQRAEYLLEHGMLDIVTNRSELRDKLIRIIGLLRQPAPPGEVLALPDSNDTVETETIMPKTATPAIDPPRPD
ncbi:MAG: acetyl-CoA carboxylase, carboxyltransferase subunit beta [Alphaproteobacteria bacterium]